MNSIWSGLAWVPTITSLKACATASRSMPTKQRMKNPSPNLSSTAFWISLTSRRSRLRAFSSMPSVTSFHQSSPAMAWISTNSAWMAGTAACSSSALAMARI